MIAGEPAGRRDPYSARFERALRRASAWHAGQTRRGSGVPYLTHVVAVAMILDRHGFDEDVRIAGLLHDAVEDSEATLAEIAAEFGPRVAAIVAHCSETKRDADGRQRPWADRKRDHLDALRTAPSEARAVVLADKFHNLLSIAVDLEEGRPVWTLFHADRDQVLWYYRASIDLLSTGDGQIEALAREAREALETVIGASGKIA